jgi:hypothetical protein
MARRISLIAVARENSDRPALQKEIARHRDTAVREGIKADPTLLGRIRELLAE